MSDRSAGFNALLRGARGLVRRQLVRAYWRFAARQVDPGDRFPIRPKLAVLFLDLVLELLRLMVDHARGCTRPVAGEILDWLAAGVEDTVHGETVGRMRGDALRRLVVHHDHADHIAVLAE